MEWNFGGVFGAWLKSVFRLFGSVGLGGGSVDADEQIEAMKELATSRDKRTAHQELVARIEEVVAAYERVFPGRTVIVTCYYRSVAEQKRLFKSGRFGNQGPILTKVDGVTKKSQHNIFPSRAADVAILIGGKVTWKDEMYWPLGALAKQCGLVWGGDWNGNGVKDEEWFDLPHFQLPGDVA